MHTPHIREQQVVNKRALRVEAARFMLVPSHNSDVDEDRLSV